MALRWYENLWPAGGVLSASLLIAWATEVLSFFLSRGLAFAVLALLQVLPEFAVEAVITRQAAFDPAQNLRYVTANFTGANRLIVGLFIPMVYFMAAARARRRGQRLARVDLPLHSSVEVLALVAPTLYSFTFVARGSLNLVDAVLLTGMYFLYLYMVYRLPPSDHESEALPLVPRTIRTFSPGRQKLVILLFFAIGSFLLFQSIHPFYENTIELGVILGISAYFLFQWVAPLLSEVPELITIVYWGRTGRAQLGLTNAISTKVNQWTLLIAMIPVVYVFSSWQFGHVAWSVEFSESQRLEILLTAAQGLFATACLINLRFQRWEAWTLVGLWAFQLFDPLLDKLIPATLPYLFAPDPDPVTGELVPHYIREWTTLAYFLLTPLPLLVAKKRWAAFHGFRTIWREHFADSKAKVAHPHVRP